jgi:hypothetical protein
MDTAPDLESKLMRCVSDRTRAFNGTSRTVEGGEEPVTH